MTIIPSDPASRRQPIAARTGTAGGVLGTALLAAGLVLACPACCKSGTKEASGSEKSTDAKAMKEFNDFLLARVNGQIKPLNSRDIEDDGKVDHVWEEFAFDKAYELGDFVTVQRKSEDDSDGYFQYRHLRNDRNAGCVTGIDLIQRFEVRDKKLSADSPLGPILGKSKEIGRTEYEFSDKTKATIVFFRILDGPFTDWVVSRLPIKKRLSDSQWVSLTLIRPGTWADTHLYKSYCGGETMRTATLGR